MAGLGKARRGWARRVAAWLGKARRGLTAPRRILTGATGNPLDGRGNAAWLGMARAWARRGQGCGAGMAGPGRAGQGKARRGEARFFLAEEIPWRTQV